MSNDLNSAGNYRFYSKDAQDALGWLKGAPQNATTATLIAIFCDENGLLMTGDKAAAMERLREAYTNGLCGGPLLYDSMRQIIVDTELVEKSPAPKDATYNVKGLIVQITPESRALDAYYDVMLSEKDRASFRRSFEGVVFYVPPGKENDAVRAELYEGRSIRIDSFVPPAVLDQAAHSIGSITFDELELRIGTSALLSAVDPRPACAVEDTPQYIARISYRHRQSFREAACNNPCENCACKTKKVLGPQI